LCVEAGVSGLSIEDSTGDPGHPLFDIEVAVARLSAARSAIDKVGGDVLLTARAECFFAGVPDLDEAIKRLKAYANAGADCLYAPGIRSREQIEAVVAAAGPLPVNVLVGSASEFSVADLAGFGVRRVSVGGGLAMVAWDAFMTAATTLSQGSFDGMLHRRPATNLNELFRDKPPASV
ncbi:MAG: isocitrate lyase/phosphoenolpyruvate mutase family protein, partial [Tepidiformaceae bacterium]